MGFFKKTEEAIEDVKVSEPKKEPITEETWVWIEGYKATDKDMKCRGYQFELGKMFTHEGELVGCKSGFHFCPELGDCFRYYQIGDGNRYFKVRALINIHQTYEVQQLFCGLTSRFMTDSDKRVAKQIEFLEEISRDDLIKCLFAGSYQTMTEKFKDNIIQYGYQRALRIEAIDKVKETNIYSSEIITIIDKFDTLELAYALAKENITQDTRLMILFNSLVQEKSK